MPLSPADIAKYQHADVAISPDAHWLDQAFIRVDALLACADPEFTEFYFVLDADEAPELDDYNCQELSRAYLKAGWAVAECGPIERRKWIDRRSEGPHCMVRYAGPAREYMPEHLIFLHLKPTLVVPHRPGWFERMFPSWRTR